MHRQVCILQVWALRYVSPQVVHPGVHPSGMPLCRYVPFRCVSSRLEPSRCASLQVCALQVGALWVGIHCKDAVVSLGLSIPELSVRASVSRGQPPTGPWWGPGTRETAAGRISDPGQARLCPEPVSSRAGRGKCVLRHADRGVTCGDMPLQQVPGPGGSHFPSQWSPGRWGPPEMHPPGGLELWEP